MKKWEISLLLALVFTAIWGAWSIKTQAELSQKMIRLHVIANSDSEADQALKLQVRDKVLSFTEKQLRDSINASTAQENLQCALPELERLAEEEVQAEGYDYPVKAELVRTAFPLRKYDSFALPSGEYLALRLIIGEGEGHNWWCVVYPPLCMATATDFAKTASDAGLSKEDIALITESDEGYVLKFRSVELWQRITAWLKSR